VTAALEIGTCDFQWKIIPVLQAPRKDLEILYFIAEIRHILFAKRIVFSLEINRLPKANDNDEMGLTIFDGNGYTHFKSLRPA
jgi:hypothetical protein